LTQDPNPHQTDIESVIHQDETETPAQNVTATANGHAKDYGKAVVRAKPTDGKRKSVRPANAPGLRVERRFTKKGEDVYSTVEWELRDAVITNERGEKVFEQKGVEIPKSWSQLATNVVVSKYFRGHIGTPQRERSVRQLIGRVANTMAGWGRAMDYFATEEDAQAFQDELTHILLHQKAAFNSPVWFNVGLPDQPRPQCSACFINSVEDTMESILTLAKTEGMLFKYGSGTGTNLSTIRGSREPLQGGGTASGPISFMRGFDQFAGAIKCLTPDAYIYTDRGLQTLGEVIDTTLPSGFHADESVTLATKDGPTRISHVYVSPEAETFRLTLQHTGLSLRGTSEHPVLTLTPSFALVWKRLADLTAGDRVAVSRRMEMWPAEAPSFQDFQPQTKSAKKTLAYPKALTPELARLLGYMVSEGSLDDERFRFSNADEEVFHDFLACVQAVFGVAPTGNIRQRVHPQTGVTTWQFEACWTNAVRFLKHVGLTTGRSEARSVPWSIRCAPRALVVEFLRAYFEGDGHVSTHVYAASASQTLLQEIQLLLLNIGMVPLLRPHAVNGKTYWCLYLRGEQAWMFVREVGFISSRKRRAAEFAGDKNTNIDVVPFLVDVLRACAHRSKYFACAGGGKRPLAFGFFNRRPGTGISYNRLRSAPGLVEKVRSLNPDWAQTLETILEREFFWDVVASVQPAEPAVTYDFTVPGTHSFVANGIINHNSGGKTRRAAKMVILDVDHPDIVDFITCKEKEERKAWALIDAGYSGAFNVPGGAYDSVSFQNANHSVRVTDEFMRACEQDGDWNTHYVLSGEVAGTYKARELMKMIGQSAWVCGDPGIQYDTTINKWHTCKNTDRIYASNPCCVTGDTLIAVADGRNAVAIKDLVGTEVPVYAHDLATGRTTISRMWNIGVKRHNAPVFRVTLDDGSSFRATDDHLIMLRDGAYRMVRDLKAGDALMPFHSKVLMPANVRTKRRYYWSGRAWKPQYRAVWEYANGKTPEGCHIHHRDFNALNDTLANLELMPAEEHAALHREGMLGDNNPACRFMSAAWRQHIAEAQRGEKNGHYGHMHSEETRRRMRERSAQRWASSEERQRSGASIKAALARAKAEGRPVGRPCGERYERCCPVCRNNFITARIEQIFCSYACRYSPMGMQMSGEKTWAHNRGRVLTADHRAKLSASVRAASDPETKRRAALTSHRNAILKAARLLLDNGLPVSLDAWDSLRAQARALGATRVPTAETVALHFDSEAALREEAALYNHKVVSVAFCGYEDVYDGTVDTHHNFAILTSTELSCAEGALNYSGVFVHNSEYMFLNDSACNLASLNLIKFRREDGEFDTEAFKHACRILITAQEIIVDNASYPTPRIAENSHDYRPLGLGYANLGALLMARGVPYDSDAGRAYAGAITALMTGEAYHQSSIIARDHGWPFPGYAKNREPFLEVMRMHRAAVDEIDARLVPDDLLGAARRAWDDAIASGEKHGYRNAQATVLAPTGCLVGDSLILTGRGLVRLRSLGDPNGAQWQRLDIEVATDEGPRQASQFYVNGVEPVVTIETGRGYRIQGTPTHRVKVVDAQGNWQWKRFADIRPGDRVPLMLGGLVGTPQRVPLPPLAEAYWTSDHTTFVPRQMTADLAEFVGYFMGDGSLHSKGIRLCVTASDRDVVARLQQLGRSLFGIEAAITERQGYTEVAFNSVRLTLWWEACGFAKIPPSQEHTGKGYLPHIPDAVLHSNDPAIYAAFVRGLFEADSTISNGYVAWTTRSESFSRDVQSLLLALGFVTTRKIDPPQAGKWGQNPPYVLRLLNVSVAGRFGEEIGFLSDRKRALLTVQDHPQAARYDHIPITREMVDELAPADDALRKTLLMSLARHGMVSRRAATELLKRANSPKLGHLLGFCYDEVATAELGEEQFTYDLSVPDNVTYVANGFVSHNTIGFLMDCDTTGIEPDIAIVKYKNLVGGGVMKIVNTTVPEALQRLGYTQPQIQAILAYIDQHDTIEGAPELKPEHLPIFDCAFKPANGTRSIHYMGHVRMMAAAQPFISGAISKTVNMPHEATPEEIVQTYIEGWKLGLKAIAIYRDGSKRTQPLTTKKAEVEEPKVVEAVKAEPAPAAPVVEARRPMRRKLPDERRSITHKFSVAGHEGYITVGMYEDGTPGEIFLTMSKEGSTISGLMDSFATAISLALQYGVPLQTLVDKFAHTRFEPSGITNNPEIRFAKSIMDYIFRWLGAKFLNHQPVNNEPTLSNGNGHGEEAALQAGPAPAGPRLALTSAEPSAQALSLAEHEHETFQNQADAPICTECGSLMVRNGACFKCLNCGSVFGCS